MLSGQWVLALFIYLYPEGLGSFVGPYPFHKHGPLIGQQLAGRDSAVLTPSPPHPSTPIISPQVTSLFSVRGAGGKPSPTIGQLAVKTQDKQSLNSSVVDCDLGQNWGRLQGGVRKHVEWRGKTVKKDSFQWVTTPLLM